MYIGVTPMISMSRWILHMQMPAWIPLICVTIAATFVSISDIPHKREYIGNGQPEWLFRAISPVLFVLLGLSGQQIWHTDDPIAKAIFLILLMTLVLWSYTQWSIPPSSLGVTIISISLILTITLIAMGAYMNEWISVLLIPLTIWLSYTTCTSISSIMENHMP